LTIQPVSDVDFFPCPLEALEAALADRRHSGFDAERYWWDYLWDGDVFDDDEDAEANFTAYGEELVEIHRAGGGKLRPELTWRLASVCFAVAGGANAHERWWPSEEDRAAVLADPVARRLTSRPLLNLDADESIEESPICRQLPRLGWLRPEEAAEAAGLPVFAGLREQMQTAAADGRAWVAVADGIWG
jgi:hypothetical protein